MRTLSRRKLGALCVLAAALAASSCSPTSHPTAAAKAIPPQPTPSLSPPLSGLRTPGVNHVIAVLAILQDYTHRVHQRRSPQPVSFSLTDAEINEYWAYSLRIKPRPGISRVVVTFAPHNEMSTVVAIDFAAVEAWNAWLIPESLRPNLAGGIPLHLDFQFDARQGHCTFTLKKLGGVSDAGALQSVMAGIIRVIGLHQPELYDTESPLTLPYGLQTIWTDEHSIFGTTASNT